MSNTTPSDTFGVIVAVAPETEIVLLTPSVLLKLKYCPFDTVPSGPLFLMTTVKFSSACEADNKPETGNVAVPPSSGSAGTSNFPLSVVPENFVLNEYNEYKGFVEWWKNNSDLLDSEYELLKDELFPYG